MHCNGGMIHGSIELFDGQIPPKGHFYGSVPGAVIGIQDEKLWSRLPAETKREFRNNFEQGGKAIIEKHLPQIKDPTTYWNEDCTAQTGTIVYVFETYQLGLARKVNNVLSSTRPAVPVL